MHRFLPFSLSTVIMTNLPGCVHYKSPPRVISKFADRVFRRNVGEKWGQDSFAWIALHELRCRNSYESNEIRDQLGGPFWTLADFIVLRNLIHVFTKCAVSAMAYSRHGRADRLSEPLRYVQRPRLLCLRRADSRKAETAHTNLTPWSNG